MVLFSSIAKIILIFIQSHTYWRPDVFVMGIILDHYVIVTNLSISIISGLSFKLGSESGFWDLEFRLFYVV